MKLSLWAFREAELSAALRRIEEVEAQGLASDTDLRTIKVLTDELKVRFMDAELEAFNRHLESTR